MKWDAHYLPGQTAFTVVPPKAQPDTKTPPPQRGAKKGNSPIKLPGSRAQFLKPKGAIHNFGAKVDKQADAIHSAKLANRKYELGTQK